MIFCVDEYDVRVSGGAGLDVLVVDTTSGITGDLAAMNVELAFGNLGNDVLDAASAMDSVLIDGGDGDDVLRGGFSDDLIIGGLGSDLTDGGLSFDSATYAGFLEDHLVSFDPSTGQYLVENTSNADVDALQRIEALTFGQHLVWLSGVEISAVNAAGEYRELMIPRYLQVLQAMMSCTQKTAMTYCWVATETTLSAASTATIT